MNSTLHTGLYPYYKGSKFLSDLGKTIFSGNRYNKKAAYDSLSQYADLNSYIDIVKSLSCLKPTPTNTTIEAKILGGNTQDTISRYGKPDFIFVENRLKIFLYERKLNDLKIRNEIHSYDDRTFSTHCIYNQLDKEDKDHLVKSIITRYFFQDFEEIDIHNCRIVDKNNDTLFISDYPGGLEIIYLGNKESGWFADMSSEINAMKSYENARARPVRNRLPAMPMTAQHTTL